MATSAVFQVVVQNPHREPVADAEVSIEVDYKLVLNVLSTGLFGVLYWLHRSESTGGDHGGHAQPTD